VNPRIIKPAILAALLFVSGCAAMKEAPRSRPHPRADEVKRPRVERSERPAPRPAKPASDRDETALREGIALYDDGEFDAAIKRLSSGDMDRGSLRNRVTALKYTAFSYCVTSRPDPCRQAFERALRLDPSFDLAPGERGHPQWGPVFVRAKGGSGR